MPELPEVETVRRGLAPVMENAKIVHVEQRRPDLRFPFPENFVQRLTGMKINALHRRAKYLLADLSSGETLVMHLGMSGSFRIETNSSSDPTAHFHHKQSELKTHDHVIIETRLAGEDYQVIYNDPRRFGYMDLVETVALHDHPWFSALGIEPTGNSLNGEALAQCFAGKAAPLKAALLDQRLVAGLGNIYVCEALWRSGLSPKRKAGTLVRKNGKPSPRLEELAFHIRETIDEAIQAGGSSLRDHRQTDGSLGYFQHRFSVYDQEGGKCPQEACEGIIQRIVQSGRSTFYCSKCQK